ncbi:MAG: hypothetical protein ACH350_08045 [Parachlamydiaceae bacterium]
MNLPLFSLNMFALITCLLLCLTSCYRMPNENEFSLVPTTNNPAVTCEKNTSILPGVGY